MYTRLQSAISENACYETADCVLTEGHLPCHYAGQVGEVVIEIYPMPDDGSADASTRLGFAVGDLAEVVQALENIGTQVVKQPRKTAGAFKRRSKTRISDGWN